MGGYSGVAHRLFPPPELGSYGLRLFDSSKGAGQDKPYTRTFRLGPKGNASIGACACALQHHLPCPKARVHRAVGQNIGGRGVVARFGLFSEDEAGEEREYYATMTLIDGKQQRKHSAARRRYLRAGILLFEVSLARGTGRKEAAAEEEDQSGHAPLQCTLTTLEGTADSTASNTAKYVPTRCSSRGGPTPNPRRIARDIPELWVWVDASRDRDSISPVSGASARGPGRGEGMSDVGDR
ncbi:hypothetical protein PG997_008467 [Apiospora hydei]|uniref:Uncharacterized protein n=1 Tax=Apiospora hydei TaxID=1337664 RepID=A0ABR1WAW8_9PEZI